MWTKTATASLCLFGASFLVPAAYAQPWAGHRSVIPPAGDPSRHIQGGTQMYGPNGVQSYNPFPSNSPLGVRYINGRRVDPLADMMNSPPPRYRPAEHETPRGDVANVPSSVHVPHVHIPHLHIAHTPVDVPKSPSSWGTKGIAGGIAGALAALGAAIVRLFSSLGGPAKRES